MMPLPFLGCLMSSGGTPAWTPADLADLGVYLDTGDPAGVTHGGGTISQLTDLSGNGHHYAGASNKPVYATDAIDGLGVARFNATTQLLTCVDDYLPAEFTMFIQLRTGLDTGSLVNLHGKGSAFALGDAAYYVDAHASDLYAAGYDGGRIISSAASRGAALRNIALRTTDEGGGVIRKRMFVDGAFHSETTTTGAALLSSTAGTHAVLGARTHNAWQGDFRRLIMYSRSLTDAERAQVDRYCGAVGGQIIYDGNSMTDGTFSTYPAECTALLSAPADQVNVGVSGQKASDMLADAASDVDARLLAAKSWKVCVYWEGLNSLNNAVPRATVLAELIQYGQERRAAGFKVVCICLPPSAFGGPTYEADRQWINAGLAAAGGDAWDAFVAESDDPTLFAAGANANATYYQGDQVHMTGAGYTRLAGVVAAKVETFIP